MIKCKMVTTKYANSCGRPAVRLCLSLRRRVGLALGERCSWILRCLLRFNSEMRVTPSFALGPILPKKNNHIKTT